MKLAQKKDVEMQIVRVDKKLIKTFVDFPDTLYKGDDNYVPYMKGDLTRTLTKLLLQDKSYVALLAMEGRKVLARVLFTVSKNKQLNTDKCGFFSMFECVNDQEVCNALLDEMIRILTTWGAEYVSGTYFPYDQDNRRGILVEGFERAPLIFTSYNKTYYDDLLTTYGLIKHADTLEYKLELDNVSSYERAKKVSEFAKKRYDFRIDTVDWSRVEEDIKDVHTVMEEATTDIIYQDAPSIDDLKNIVLGWKNYLNKDYILIARSNVTNEPIGIVIALPDYFQVFKKMRGRMDLIGLFAFAHEKRRIKSVRAILQYVVPRYQRLGVTIALYVKLYEAMLANGITYMEAGTIMENNEQSNDAIKSIGATLARRYRLYYKELKQ